MPTAWHPGSFTKNFSWGPENRGLKELYDVIRTGFDGNVSDVPRALFRSRVKQTGRPDYVPLNFFLFNTIKNGVDFVVADELVFQAINFKHSTSFDKLALFAFNLSSVGVWKRAAGYQAHPAEWAKHYIIDRVGIEHNWDTRKVSADDIEKYVLNHPLYAGQTVRKLATNLAYIYRQGRLSDFRTKLVERWWIGALFLTLDRASVELLRAGQVPQEERYQEYAIKSDFPKLSGPRSTEKDLAAIHFTKLYSACGGVSRFSDQATLERQKILLPDVRHFANNPEPVGAFHPQNPRARGAIPRACAMLAQYVAGFECIDIEELDDFDVELYISNRTRDALDRLSISKVAPTMSVDELLKITRGE